MLVTSRRSLILGAGASLLAAPAIVRAASLMKVRAVLPDIVTESYLDKIVRLYGITRRPAELDYSLRERMLRQCFYYQKYATAQS